MPTQLALRDTSRDTPVEDQVGEAPDRVVGAPAT